MVQESTDPLLTDYSIQTVVVSSSVETQGSSPGRGSFEAPDGLWGRTSTRAEWWWRRSEGWGR